MYWNRMRFLLLALFVAASSGLAQPTNQTNPLREFRHRAAQFNSVVTLPDFETTTNLLMFDLRQTIAVGNAALGRIGALKPHEVTFENTVRALDDIGFQISQTDDRLGADQGNQHQRRAARRRHRGPEAVRGVVGRAGIPRGRLSGRQGLRGHEAQAAGEDAKLLAETMRDYRRAGLDLPKAQRDEVERMRKELTRLTTDFESNITKAAKTVKFTQRRTGGGARGLPGAGQEPAMTNTPSRRTSPWHYITRDGQRQARRNAQEADHRARQPGAGGEHPLAPEDPAPARRRCPEARLQDLGRLPDRNEDGQERGHGHGFPGEAQDRLAAQVRRRAGRVPRSSRSRRPATRTRRSRSGTGAISATS